jgi:hypothetical protein
MFGRILRVRGIIPVILILAALGYWWLHPRPPKVIAIGYVADREIPLWNTIAEVRQPVGNLHYGERVEVVRQEGAAAQVRVPSGALGWLLDARQLVDAALWEKSAALLARTRSMPVQARGRTKTLSNVHIDPGRNSKRIYQFTRGTQVLMLDRTIADATPSSEDSAAGEKGAGGEDQKPKQEDWLLVLRAEGSPPASGAAAHDAGSTAAVSRASRGPVSGGPNAAPSESPTASSSGEPVAGWVLARFIEPELPGPVRDYASSANLHVVAWFELNHVPDGSGGQVPQYLVAGSHGGEGQACDFTMLRVYTWSTARKRYETAYIESDLCGHMPIEVSQSLSGPEFHFANAGKTPAERMYVMRQTVVHHVTNKSSGAPIGRH